MTLGTGVCSNPNRAKVNNKLRKWYKRTASAKSHKSPINSPKAKLLEERYDYRRDKCHFLFSSGLKEAKIYEDAQSGGNFKERFRSADATKEKTKKNIQQ